MAARKQKRRKKTPKTKKAQNTSGLSLSLQELIREDLLWQAQDNFAKAAGVASGVIDAKGDWVGEPSKQQRFCRDFIRSTPQGEQRCLDCDRKHAEQARKQNKPVVYRCHAGLLDFAVPIRLRNRTIGTLLGGQALPTKKLTKADEARFRKVAEELGLNGDALVEAAGDVPRISKIKMHKIATEAGKTAELIATAALYGRSLLAVQDGTARIYAAQTEEDVWEAMMSSVEDIFGFSTCCITMPDDMRRVLRLVAHRGLNPGLIRTGSIPIDSSLAGWIYTQGEPAVIPDLDADDRISSEYRKKGSNRRIKACLGAPLKGRKATIGVIQLGANRKRAYDQNDVVLLSMLTTHAATAIENLRLQSFSLVAEIVHELDTMFRERTNASKVRQRLLDITVAALHRLPNVRWSSVRTVEENLQGKQQMYLTAWEGQGWTTNPAQPYDIKEAGIPGTAARLKMPRLIEHVKQARDYVEVFPDTRSHLSVPIVFDGRALAVLTIESDKPEAFDREYHLPAMSHLGHLVATSFNDVQLYARHRLGEIERTLNSPGKLSDGFPPSIVAGVTDIVGAEACSIFIRDHASDDYVLAATTGIKKRKGKKRISYKAGDDQGMTGWVLQHGRSLRLADVGDKKALSQIDPNLSRKNRHTEKLARNRNQRHAQFMAAPILIGGEVEGVIRAVSCAKTISFREVDERMLVRVAGAIAAALQKRRVLDQLKATADISREVADIEDLKKATQVCLKKGLKAIGCLSGHIRLRDTVTGEMVRVAVAGKYASRVPERVGPNEGFCGRVANRRDDEPWVIADTQKERIHKKLLKDAEGTPYLKFLQSVRSEILVPLRAGNELIGIFNAHKGVPNGFTDYDKAWLQQFCEHIASIIRNIRLLNEARDQAKALDELTRLIAARAIGGSEKRLLESVLRAAGKAVPAQAIGIFLQHELDKTLVLRAIRGGDATNVGKLTFGPGEGIIAHVGKTDKPVMGVLERVRRHAAWDERHGKKLSSVLKSGRIEDLLAVPIRSFKSVIGVLLFINKKPRRGEVLHRSFFRADRQTAKLAGLQIGTAVHIARDTEALRALWKSAKQLAVEPGLEAALQTIVDSAAKLAGTNRAMIHLVSHDGQNLEMKALSSMAPPMRPVDLKVNQEKSIIADAFRTGRRRVTRNAPQHPLYVKFYDDTVSEAAVPLIAGKTTIGVLNMESKQSDKFGGSVVNQLESFASLAAVAVERHRRTTKMLAMERMAGVGMLSAAVAHQINNTLGGCLLGTQNALDAMRDQWESKESVVHDSLAHILQSCQFLRGFVVCLQGLGRPGSDDMNSCNLNDIVSEVVRMLHKQFAQGEVRFELELAKKLPAVRGNANRLGHAVMNLAMNARDSMPKGGTIHLRTQYRPKHRVVLTCTDTGTGMPADVRKKIFDPFFTTKAKDVGLGMGLHVVREIVEKEHHGTIHVQSAVGEGSRFMLSLPRFLKKEKR